MSKDASPAVGQYIENRTKRRVYLTRFVGDENPIRIEVGKVATVTAEDWGKIKALPTFAAQVAAKELFHYSVA